MQLTGHTARQGASVQCMQATDTERSPGTPSLMVTTRRRFTPQGVSFSFLHAVTQPLQSMQRSVSQMNFILRTCSSPVPVQGPRPRVCYARTRRHSDTLVSCIIVTAS
jgi:hypothetical protein